jgi:phage regulator Rha-like protein
MSDITAYNPPCAMMTSREIAELTGKHHHHVSRDIRKMLSEIYKQPETSFSPEEILKNQQSPDLDSGVRVTQYGVNNAGLPVFQYHLDKNHTLTLLTGYDIAARFKVVARWQELEEKAAVIPFDQHPDWYITRLKSRNAFHPRRSAVVDRARIEAMQKYFGEVSADTLIQEYVEEQCRRESNMINYACLGMTASRFRGAFGVPEGALLRDHLPVVVVDAIEDCERFLEPLNRANVPYETRYTMLKDNVLRKFPTLSAFVSDQERRLAERMPLVDPRQAPELTLIASRYLIT